MREAIGSSSLLSVAILVVVASAGCATRRAAAARDPRRPDDAVRRRRASTRPRCITPSTTARARWAAPASRAEAAGATESGGVAFAAGVAARSSRWARDGARAGRRVRHDAHGLLRGPDAHAHVRVHALGRTCRSRRRRGSRARRLGGGRRLRRERRDQGGPGVRGDAPGADVITTASVHDFRNLAPRRGDAQGRDDVAHRGLRVLDRARLPVELASRQLAHRRSAAQHAVRALVRAQLRQRLRSRAARERDEPDALDRARELDRAASPTTRRGRRTPIDIDTYEASWAQSWTPVIATQLTYTGAAPRRLPGRPVPERRARRRAQGAGARPDEPRARGRHGARRLVPAPDQARRCGSRSAATTTPGPSRAAPPRPSSRSPSASRCG